MDQKSDETLDHWIWQSINQLPATPPPGSSFDSERLWAQLRPAIQVTPSRRPALLAGWLAAACLTGLVAGWFWLHQLVNPHPTDVAHRNGQHKVATPIVTHQFPESIDKIVVSKPIVFEKKRLPAGRLIRSHKPQKQFAESVLRSVEPTEIGAQATALPMVTEISTATEKPVERSKSAVAATAPKRRFRIVHENELRAEEEARPKLYHTEHFVRLGTRQPAEITPDDRQPVLLMPLTSKPNQ